MTFFYGRTYHWPHQFPQYPDDFPDHANQTPNCLIYDQITHPHKKAPHGNCIDKHSDRRPKYRCKADHSIISIIQQRKAKPKASCPVEDIFKVNSKPSMPYQPPEQSEHIIYKSQKCACSNRNQPKVPLLYNFPTHQPNRRVSSPSPFFARVFLSE